MVRYIKPPVKPDFKGSFECQHCLGEVEYDGDDINVDYGSQYDPGDSYYVICPCLSRHYPPPSAIPGNVLKYARRSRK